MRTGAGAAIAAMVSLAVPACETTAAPPPPPSVTAATPVSTDPVPAGTTCVPPAIADPLVVTGVYREHAAGCVPPRRLVAVRCSGLVDPVIVLGARRREPMLYLGGRFAVPGATVPEDATPLGVSATERVWATPEHDLLVEAGASITSWLRLPEPRALRGRPAAWLIGDSILDGADDAVVAALPRWELSVDAVVLELGTNDADPASFRAASDSMSAALAGVPLVMWVVPRSPKVSAAAIASAIREVASTYPNATTADWAADAPADAFSEDGVHLLPDRQDAFASFLAERLTAWARATRGDGATSCVPQVAEALSAPAG